VRTAPVRRITLGEAPIAERSPSAAPTGGSPVRVVHVRTARTAGEWDAARDLVHRYLAWLTGAAGVDHPELVVPGAVAEAADVRAVYDRPAAALLLATVGGRPAGVLGLRPRWPKGADLSRLWVDPRARGVGVGRALLREVDALAVRLGHRHLRLEVAPAIMPAAMRLSRADGFEEVGRRSRPALDDVLVLARPVRVPRRGPRRLL
jgi:carbonic anhydrase